MTDDETRHWLMAMTDVIDLRQHRIRRAKEALRRAGYRTPVRRSREAPSDAEAHRWVCAVEAGDGEHGRSRHRPLWSPRKESEDWQRARFGPCEPPSPPLGGGDTDPAPG